MPTDVLHAFRLRNAEQALAFVRLVAALFAVLDVGVITKNYPDGYELAAWVVTAVFLAGSIVLFLLSRREHIPSLTGAAALSFDLTLVAVFGIVYSFEYGSPTRWALIFVVVEGALRYGRSGGILVSILLLPYLFAAEVWRADRFGPPDFLLSRIAFPFGIFVITGVIVGWLVDELARATQRVEARAAEAERLRDELGRRLDSLEAANRCARALASTLELEQAFDAFTRELRGLVPFDRMVVTRREDDVAHVMATAGIGAEKWPAGTSYSAPGPVVDRVHEGATQVRKDMRDGLVSQEQDLVELGMRARVVAPLQASGATLGFFSLSRAEPDSFSDEEVELVTLLGRIIAASIQNIRAYEAERTTVDELRRLSALRADFVSLVSHELRSPMAAVLGSARTLQQRWDDLSPQQREAFLAVIADETSRLARLIEDVLHTSRIEAGTFTYRFDDVDLTTLVREAVATARHAQDEVTVNAEVLSDVPVVRGDAERLRQLVDNLVSNAVKYSDPGHEVRVTIGSDNGTVRLAVQDHGPGIPEEYHRTIFEKFGRINPGSSKPGTGLGLFIARSIAEAHGGTLDVRSSPGYGTTFVLTLPL